MPEPGFGVAVLGLLLLAGVQEVEHLSRIGRGVLSGSPTANGLLDQLIANLDQPPVLLKSSGVGNR